MTNDDLNLNIASKVIRETLSDGMIRLNDTESKSKRYAKYVLF